MAGMLSFFQKCRSCISQRTIVYVVCLLAFFIIVFGPLLGLFLDLIKTLLSGSGKITLSLLFSERKIVLLGESVGLALAVSIAGIGVGIAIATLLWQTGKKITYSILLLLLALAPIPPYIYALTWSTTLYALNQFLASIGAALVPSTGWVISFWVQLMALLPLAIFLSYIGLASVDKTLVEAARTIRSDGRVLREIILPLAAPSLLVACGFLFLISITDYSVPSLFGSDTYALDIFAQFSASNSPSATFISAIPLLIVTIAVLILCRSGIRKLAQTPNWMVGSWDTPPEFPTSFQSIQKGAFALLAVQMMVIFFGLVFSVGSWNKFVSTVLFSVNQLQYSCLVVIAVVLITIPFSLLVAHELMNQNARSSLWWLIILIPIAIPSPLIGIGIISFWNIPTLSFLYGTSLMPIFASVSRFAPYAVIILFVQYRFIDPVLFDAVKVFSRDIIDEWFEVKIPLLAPGLLIASGVVAALTLGELGATIVVVPPGHETLTIKIYNYLHYGASAEVTGLCLIMAIVTFIIGLCAVSSILWWRRRGILNQAVPRIGDLNE